jgi:hypothetical protein
VPGSGAFVEPYQRIDSEGRSYWFWRAKAADFAGGTGDDGCRVAGGLGSDFNYIARVVRKHYSR